MAKKIVGVVALIKNASGEKFLMLKRSASSSDNPGKWSFPGGAVEHDETASLALKTHVLEETGINVQSGFTFLLDYVVGEKEGVELRVACYIASSQTEEIQVAPDFDYYLWVNPKEVEGFDTFPGVKEAVERAFK